MPFSYPLPTAGQGRDFHPIERAPAGRTKKGGPRNVTRLNYYFGKLRFHSLEVGRAVLADWADEICRNRVALVDISADYADPLVFFWSCADGATSVCSGLS